MISDHWVYSRLGVELIICTYSSEPREPVSRKSGSV